MPVTPNIETPRLRPTVAEEVEIQAAHKVADWLKKNAPAEVNQCFSGMRALANFVSESRRFRGKVSQDANQTILADLGTVVNAISVLDSKRRRK